MKTNKNYPKVGEIWVRKKEKMKRRESHLKFTNLHGHSVAGSPFDALGYPQEHMDYAYENGCDALALTDHGNMNGFAYQYLHANQMKKDGKEFKPIFGVEAYYVDSVKAILEANEKEKTEGKKEKEETGIIFEGETVREEAFRRNRLSHFLLLAQNDQGLKNLFTLVTLSHSKEDGYFYRKPRIDYELLKKYNQGIIASTTCISGVFAGIVWQNPEATQEQLIELMCPHIDKFLDIFGKDRFLVELQWNAIPEQHKLNLAKIEIAKKYGLTLISTVDSHYPRPELWKSREVYKRLAWLNRTHKPAWIEEAIPESVNEMGYELYPKNGDQMFSDYKKYAERCDHLSSYDDEIIRQSIENTYKVAHEWIGNVTLDTSAKLPGFLLETGMDENEELKKRCYEVLKAKNLSTNVQYVERLEQELKVVQDRKFSKYFITAEQIAVNGRKKMLMSPGRGSSGGSLIAYLLNITQIDPIKWGTMFSRFLRSDATDFPDIDMDFSREDELKSDLESLWGRDSVVRISNWNTLQLKSLIKDISKLLEIPYEEVNQVTTKMMKEATPLAKAKNGIKSGVYTPTWEEVLEFSESLQNFLEVYPQVATHIKPLMGQVRSGSTHAGGVVISEKIGQNMPLILSGGEYRTPWSEGQNVRHLEPLGFIKFDILGISSLGMIEDCIKQVLIKLGNPSPSFEDICSFYEQHLHPDTIDFNDQKVYEKVFKGGEWPGIFQFSEKPVQSFCMKANPTSLYDLAAITSIYRPGPLGAGVDELYLAAKEKPTSVHFLNKAHKEVTQKSLGFLIFQEQIATLMSKLSQYISEEDGHNVRKLLTKKEKGGVKVTEGIEDEFIRNLVGRDISVQNAKKLKNYYQLFLKGSQESGLSEQETKKLWETIEYYSGYGFNFSHALAYSMVSFQCAWLYTYFPTEWVCAYLNKETGDGKENALNVVAQLGYKIGKVDINHSQEGWSVKDGELLPPLTMLKGFGEKASMEIFNNRPFDSLEQLLFNENISYQKFNKKSLDVLIRSGSLREFYGEEIKTDKQLYMSCVENRPKTFKQFEKFVKEFESVQEFSLNEQVENEYTITGIYPYHLVMNSKVFSSLVRSGVTGITNFDKNETEGVVWGIMRDLKEKKTSTGKTYWILQVTDETGGEEEIKVWGVADSAKSPVLNFPYMLAVSYEDKWGFSMRDFNSSARVLK